MRINPEHGQAENDLARQFGVSYFPSVYLVPKQGARPQRIQIGANITPASFVKSTRNAF